MCVYIYIYIYIYIYTYNIYIHIIQCFFFEHNTFSVYSLHVLFIVFTPFTLDVSTSHFHNRIDPIQTYKSQLPEIIAFPCASEPSIFHVEAQHVPQ